MKLLLLPSTLLLLAKTGLSSSKKPSTLGSNDGENRVGDIGRSEAGTGDKTPGNEAGRSTVASPSISNPPTAPVRAR
ncbi:hypothetical protein C4D60_Mb06t13640 [Musa balbisiana]|uniref:Uncharacterized protein n=1 Tax=Musa balbisiana TaxID=52838 RepID=A0A4S8IMR7_MUSBA|nr:hypothetical protein C4D60_Mb06t13640 [Musa balbisiana]